MELHDLKQELKLLLIQECDLDIDAEEIEDAEQLIGDGSRFGLDSLDALAVSLEVKTRFGKRIDGGNETRMALQSIDTLSSFILDP